MGKKRRGDESVGLFEKRRKRKFSNKNKKIIQISISKKQKQKTDTQRNAMSSEIAATSEAEPVSHEDLQLKFFNFAPSAFFNTVFQAVDDYIADGLDRMEIVMVPSFSGSEREALKTCNDQLMDLITNTYNKNMDKFEIYATRNLFNIPEEAQKVREERGNEFFLSRGNSVGFKDDPFLRSNGKPLHCHGQRQRFA